MDKSTQAKRFLAHKIEGYETSVVAVNDDGFPVGEDHQRSRYSNHVVERAMMLRRCGFTYHEISDELHIPIGTIHDWVAGYRRNQSVAGWKVFLRKKK